MSQLPSTTAITHLECFQCGQHYSCNEQVNTCKVCGGPLSVSYNLDNIAHSDLRNELKTRSADMWRYHEILPPVVLKNRITLGEGFTPLLPVKRIGKRVNIKRLWIKEESQNPTGSFKARGMSMAVSRCLELGIDSVVLPSAGNAAAALAAYAASAGLHADVYLPDSTPRSFIAECQSYGTTPHLIPGTIADCGRVARQHGNSSGAFDLSTLSEPYRLEGKKTLGWELAEQSRWVLPDVIIYPTGGGTGFIGMWLAFQELLTLGWIEKPLPRMVVVQSCGCAPLVAAFQKGAKKASPWPLAQTIAWGIRVPSALGDFIILDILKQSGGIAVAVAEQELLDGQMQLSRLEGIDACPEGGATVSAAAHLSRIGWLHPDDRVVLFNTGTGLKYLDNL